MQNMNHTEYSEQANWLLRWQTNIAIFLFIATMLMNFLYVGTEQTQGNVQRIFYIHLGSFFGSFVLFAGAVIAGIQYLRTRLNKWDDLGHACIEVGLGFSLITIITGMFWARPIWNTWWTWDPRLTTIAIMWLSYAAYLMLRAGIEDPDRRRRFAAVYGILAFGSVLLTVIIIRVRPDTIHPVSAGPTSTAEGIEGNFDMTPRITQTVLFNIFTFIWLALTVTWHRIRLENRTNEVESRKMQLLLNE
jgi:heme exporter protein C